MTAGEDGCVYFWNIMSSYLGQDLSKVENFNVASPNDLIVRVLPRQVHQVRSIHDIHLTADSQIYCIVIGPEVTTFVDNSGIMTYYLTKHLTPKEEIEYDENERLAKEAEEAEKRRI